MVKLAINRRMNFSTFLIESLLLEGGAAIKGSSKVSQVEARHLIPDLADKIAKVTKIDREKIKAVGSAGKKPSDNDMSGDIDFAIECNPDILVKSLAELSHDGEAYKAMSNINVYSFGTKINGKVIQVDMVPVHNIDFAVWSYISDPDDLAKGLKGAQRNEVMFAVAKHVDLKKIKDEKTKETIELDRHFFDLSKGLMRGVQTRKKPNGKLGKGFTTIDKNVITNDPKEVSEKMFGKDANPEKLKTFDGVWEAIHGENFPWKNSLDDIIKMTKDGIKKKNLKMPDQLL
jgi:hypothetical protein